MRALEPNQWAVYFARGLTSGLTKIGCSRRPDLRAQTLALEVREPVEFFAAYRSQALRMSEERALHQRFAHLADPSRGREWFRDDGSIAAFVASLPEAAHGSFTRRPGIKSKRGARRPAPSFVARPVPFDGVGVASLSAPITSHVASVPERPGFVAFTPRAVLALCHCAQRVSGVWYARSGCIVCNGGGHRAVSAEVRGG